MGRKLAEHAQILKPLLSYVHWSVFTSNCPKLDKRLGPTVGLGNLLYYKEGFKVRAIATGRDV